MRLFVGLMMVSNTWAWFGRRKKECETAIDDTCIEPDEPPKIIKHVKQWVGPVDGDVRLFPENKIVEKSGKPLTGVAFPGGGARAFSVGLGTVRALLGIDKGDLIEISAFGNRVDPSTGVQLGPPLGP